MRKYIESSGGRRFSMTIGAGTVSSILVWFGKITSEAWAAVVISTVAAYIAGNTYQKTKTPMDKEQ
jgi:hypothetical protein